MSSWIKSSRCYNNCFRNAAPRMPKKADVQSFWKTSHRFAVNNPDKRGHQYAPFHTRSLNAKLLGLSSNRRARNPYAAQNLCFKGSSATCIKVCTSDLLTEGIPLVGMETLVGWITLQHEEGHRVVWELLRVVHLTLASGRGCRTRQKDYLSRLKQRNTAFSHLGLVVWS